MIAEFDFTFNLDTVGLIGRKGTGKTYLTKQILAEIPKQRAFILDAKRQYPEWINVYNATMQEYNVETIDAFIKTIYGYHDIIAVFDDIDLFIKHANESEMLANFLINAGTGRHIGAIWQAKRLANIDLRTLTESKYLILGQGIIEEDQKRLLQAGFNQKLYLEKVATVENEHTYVLLNTFKHTNTIITTLK